jgi:hypothetical protein
MKRKNGKSLSLDIYIAELLKHQTFTASAPIFTQMPLKDVLHLKKHGMYWM